MSSCFRWLVVVLCSGFLLLQVIYISGLPLVMDEFANAGHIFRVVGGVPYRDYAPYKTVLGYYLLLPALVAFESTWTAMLAAKTEVAILTAAVLGAAAWRLRRHFAEPAIIGALLLLVTQNTFLERSSELRVDMLSALFGLASLVAYLERRAWLAGVVAGCAVLMTQKGAYFVLSLGGAGMLQIMRCRSRLAMVEALRTAAGVLAAIGVYVGFWCALGSPTTLWQSMFQGPRTIAFAQLYSLGRFWLQTLERNPIFYGFGLAGLVLLAPHWRSRDDSVCARLWGYASVLTLLCVWHRQPWPYFFVMLIPTAWVVTVAVLDRYQGSTRCWSLIIAALVGVGALCSVSLRVPAVLARSSTHQRHVVESAEAFLDPGESYLAGTELLWRRRHVEHLSWLDAPHLQALQVEFAAPLTELRSRPPRLLIENYRLSLLPEVLLEELDDNFCSVGGNLRTYCPRLVEGSASTSFAHGGLFRVVGPPEGRVRIDDEAWAAAGELVRVTAGRHWTEAEAGARLASWSESALFIAQTERASENLFERVYTY